MIDRPRYLRAGALSAELVGADLRMVRMGGVEIARRITTALRDTDWGTAPATVEAIAVDGDDVGFAVHATVLHDLPEGSFRHTLAIRGTPDGRLSYRIRGASLQPLRTNRVGLCVLLPPSACEGRAYRCERDTGEVENDHFPDTVMPQKLLANGDDRPPLAGIRKLTLGAGGDIAFAFEGPPFCLEDQRNWTDASYKCCMEDPPELPVVLDPADAVVQGVVVTTTRGGAVPETSEAIVVTLGEVTGALPPIGPAGSSAELAELSRSAFAHLEVHAASELEPPAGARLELELRLPVDESIATAIRSLGDVLDHVVVVDPSAPLAREEDVKDVAARLGVAAGAGAPAGYVGISTYGRVAPAAQALWWTICPQVHADDDRTILENATCQGATVHAARRLAPGARTSVTLRFAPEGVDDPRATGAIGAAWLAAGVAALATAGVSAISVAASMLRDSPGSTPAAVMRLLAARAGARVRTAAVTDELAIAALELELPRRAPELLLVNLRDEPADLAIAGREAAPARRVERLDPYEVRLVELCNVPTVLNEPQGASA